MLPPHPVPAAGRALPALSQSIRRSAPSPGSCTSPVLHRALLQNHPPEATPLYSWCLLAPSGLFSPLLSAPPGVFPLSARRSGRRQDNGSTHLPASPAPASSTFAGAGGVTDTWGVAGWPGTGKLLLSSHRSHPWLHLAQAQPGNRDQTLLKNINFSWAGESPGGFQWWQRETNVTEQHKNTT